MEYAIIKASGRQHWIELGRFIDLNQIKLKLGTTVYIKRVLLVKNQNKILLGTPFIKQHKIKGIICKHFFGPKKIIYKIKPKKKYRRKKGKKQILRRVIKSNV